MNIPCENLLIKHVGINGLSVKVCEQMMTGAGKTCDRCSRRFAAYVKGIEKANRNKSFRCYGHGESVLFHQDANFLLYVSPASSHPQSASTCFMFFIQLQSAFVIHCYYRDGSECSSLYRYFISRFPCKSRDSSVEISRI